MGSVKDSNPQDVTKKIDAMSWGDVDIDDMIAGFGSSNENASRRGSTTSAKTEPVSRKASMNSSK